MKFTATAVEGVFLIEPRVFEDGRGFFFESYRRDEFVRHGITADFVQDNHSRSSRGVLRGLHFQTAPYEQAKLARVARGGAFDVVVDIRKGSKTYGRHIAETLTADNKKMLYLPAGVAHGFLALEDGTEFLYKVSQPYSPGHERGVLWNDPKIGIAWPKMDIDYVLSEKDKKFPLLQNI